MHFSEDLINYQRFKTRVVNIGDVPLGGNNPIRVQSMTTTDTMDTVKTINQSIRMIEAGCEYVRITAPSIKEAENLAAIKKGLKARGFITPLIADIHFTPNAAELAAKIVEKVRVNPGNYADKKKFESINYTDDTYEAELERIRKRFTPLVKICKEYGTAMRIGTNHGSLSDRILSRYGDTPLGMVESAFEFLRICEENNYHNIVLSMKSSNAQVMVQAYRLLVAKMIETKRNYPLHLGVTEAGEGEDGRIKSALGIGTLLEDGLGDTIRVSLTEEPEFEIPVAKSLLKKYSEVKSNHFNFNKELLKHYTPFDFQKRTTTEIVNIGGENVPRVVADFSERKEITPATLFSSGYIYSKDLDKWNLSDMACDYIYCGDLIPEFQIPGTLGVIINYKSWKNISDHIRIYPLVNPSEYGPGKFKHSKIVFILIKKFSDLKNIGNENNLVFVLENDNDFPMASFREFMLELKLTGKSIPVIFKKNYSNCPDAEFQLFSSRDTGSLFIDGFGDGLWLTHSDPGKQKIINETSFGILQAARTRISKTEYISCPSCGRTLFDLQETTQKIRKRTDHLKGIKIGIMGCIVNGPGEMADADYGYVGTGIGKITLYKGRNVVKRNINSESAVDELISLIREHGDWAEPTTEKNEQSIT